jgi:hypothetical protein
VLRHVEAKTLRRRNCYNTTAEVLASAAGVKTKAEASAMNVRPMRADVSHHDFRSARLACQEAVDAIAEAVIAARQHELGRVTQPDFEVDTRHLLGRVPSFFDDTFFLGDWSAIAPSALHADAASKRGYALPVDSMRACDVFPNSQISLFGDVVYDETPNVNLSRPGHVGDSHLIAAISALLLRRNGGVDRIRRLFVLPIVDGATDEKLEIGVIGCVLYLNGCWTWVIIDDTLAISADRRPWFMSLAPRPLERSVSVPSTATSFRQFVGQMTSSAAPIASRLSTFVPHEPAPHELWPLLLEKAVAKALGSYEALNGGSVSEALTMLTGGLQGSGPVAGTHSMDPPVPASLSAIPKDLGGDDAQYESHLEKLATVGKSHTRRQTTTKAAAVTHFPADGSGVEATELGVESAFLQLDELFNGRDNAICFACLRVVDAPSAALHRRRALIATREEKLEQFTAELAHLESLAPQSYMPLLRVWREEGSAEPYVTVIDLFSDEGDVLDAAYSRQRERVLRERLQNQSDSIFDRSVLPKIAVPLGAAARIRSLPWRYVSGLFDRIEYCMSVLEPSDIPGPLLAQRIRTVLPPHDMEEGRLALADDGSHDIVCWHTISAFGTAPPTVSTPEEQSRYQPPFRAVPAAPIVLDYRTPVSATVIVALEQEDVRLRGAAEAGLNKTPLCHLQLCIYAFGATDPAAIFTRSIGSRSVHGVLTALDDLTHHSHIEFVRCSPIHYRRQIHLTLSLEPGFYLVVPRVLKGPSIDYCLRILAPAASVMNARRLPLPSEFIDTELHRPVTDDERKAVLSDARAAVPFALLPWLEEAPAPKRMETAGANSSSDDDDEHSRAGVQVKGCRDASGAITTRFLPRSPASIVAAVTDLTRAQTLAKQAVWSAGPENALQGVVPDPVDFQGSYVEPNADNVTARARASLDVSTSSIAAAFATADVLGTGQLREQRHVQRALEALLLRGTSLGRALTDATQDAASCTAEEFGARVDAALTKWAQDFLNVQH